MIQPYQAAVDTHGRGRADLPRRAVQPRHRQGTPAPARRRAADPPLSARADRCPHADRGPAGGGPTSPWPQPSSSSGPRPTPGSIWSNLADGTPAVLELELLDPALFFETDPAAAARFAQVLRALIPRARTRQRVSCRPDSRRGAGPSDSAAASRAARTDARHPSGYGRMPWRMQHPVAQHLVERRPQIVPRRLSRTAPPSAPRFHASSRRYLSCAFCPFGVSRITLPRPPDGSGSGTTHSCRSRKPSAMLLASFETPVSAGRSLPHATPRRRPASSTRKVLALIGSEILDSPSKSMVNLQQHLRQQHGQVVSRNSARLGERPVPATHAPAPAAPPPSRSASGTRRADSGGAERRGRTGHAPRRASPGARPRHSWPNRDAPASLDLGRQRTPYLPCLAAGRGEAHHGLVADA